ncbi:histidine phosphatase family protein [Sulfitobacter donghicola]|uniref:Phosphoglycerate mutase n=1 Tax=Sulfitobacter donghicola DSW-25 = KCTC 12864 = JCM 14565 TaxID=1300350 RepID=A0A073ILI8_9RHOB|nr:histidine phosphatase family protein [Sulfitobacter donghicola]KEJ90366.1 phosphoglycerate mutase [Sulfitobacter donghicola DSW-25 = KCTC 12864 = JCM 14565]KIN67591.1 Phosphoglycerate mutase family protein [Sulfitobacter donghicola DSW-25 = KCTC 12864 = JCM 14565]
MSTITLIRHGQANSTATDEASYDRLSDLGHEQAKWLGDHLRDTRAHNTRLFTGTLQRHIETADGMATGLAPTRDARLNELEYFTLANLMEQQHGIPFPTEQPQFIDHLPQVLKHWRDDKLEGAPETYDQFQSRIRDALKEIAADTGPALVVTSGGLIAHVIGQQMELSIEATARTAIAIFHTSMHQLHPIGGHLSPVLFNATPHLDTPSRNLSKTNI